MQTNLSNILLAISFTVFINTFSYAQDVGKKRTVITPQDSIAKLKVNDSLLPKLTTVKAQDTIKTDSIIKKGVLTDIIKHSATGYTDGYVKERKTYLYDEAKITYGLYDISAGVILIDYSKNLVYAGRIKDSTGFSQRPVFKQGADIVESDSIVFNFKTKKALIWNSKTEQQGGTIYPEISKKENDSVFFIKNFKFTTSENPENPEYYFYGRKAKVVPGKKVVTGPINLYIADVPTPVGVPFGFFPLTRNRTSGVIFPTFGEETERGFFVQNGGYYFAISDYLDLATTGDYYTNGSYGFRAESNYAVRYKFRGNFRLSLENNIVSERGFPDFSESNLFNLNWTHTRDPKTNPNSNFSARVNLGSSQFFQQSLNQINTPSRFNNTLQSSVSYSRRFQTNPEVNLSLTATHSQNTNNGSLNLTLPSFQASVARVFPFAPKTGAKKGLFQNINLQYNLSANNSIQTTEDEFSLSTILDDSRTNAIHSIPINTNFKLFKFFSFSANTNYNEVWTLNTINRFQSAETGQLITEDLRGFDTFRTYNFGASLGTTIYGQKNFKKGSRIEAIRHVIRPSISYNISPAFNQFFENIQVIDTNGNVVDELEDEFTRFEGSGGSISNRLSSNINITVGNTLEAKVRSRDSTATEPKKITLLNNLNFTTGINLTADSLKISPVNVTGSIPIIENLSINFGATLDPYALDNNNRRINTFNIENGGGLFRVTNARINTGYNFSSGSFSRRRQERETQSQNENLRNGGRDDDFFGVSQDFANQPIGNDDAQDEEELNNEFYNFAIPWSLRVAYTINFSNSIRQNEVTNHSVMLSGDIQLSPLWSVGVSTGFDLVNRGITGTQFRFERDLKSWRMNLSYTPPIANSNGFWNFFIGVKSSILSDLKYEKRRQPDRQL